MRISIYIYRLCQLCIYISIYNSKCAPELTSSTDSARTGTSICHDFCIWHDPQTDRFKNLCIASGVIPVLRIPSGNLTCQWTIALQYLIFLLAPADRTVVSRMLQMLFPRYFQASNVHIFGSCYICVHLYPANNSQKPLKSHSL